ncbi:hypothetical protein EJ05DRAFT_503223 [Pseudovirgaria hyperparasitica]|uniref:Uncharacterized protein n=1 Tax=Pseudovirgaria hyperparasitica TaxID=470096 RepID=A0A6A6W404_9PEZI|nr:uncharacterized protein EJ05DRAFT_503223 [Pseudovirgaria hyperparasitica]KAF2755771.1 hypothetical protein EJ05DRAFT_503223 [Pseudovirgaria hyperparasitica]
MRSSRWAPKPVPGAENENKIAPEVKSQEQPAPAPALQLAPAMQEPAPLGTETIAEPLPQEIQSVCNFHPYVAFGLTTNKQTFDAYDPMMDEFSQTREDDDLFADDVVPVVDASTVVIEAPSEAVVPDIKSIPTGPAAHSRGRGGRGRGRGRGSNHIHHNEKKDIAEGNTVEKENGAGVATTTANATATMSSPTDDAKETPVQPPRKEGAVRGDRSKTGGVKKAKLTEAELSAKMASMSLLNATKLAAHTRAEADRRESDEREARAAEESQKRRAATAAKQKVERATRTEMLGEREKNRQRKMNALTGREWDAEKEEGFGGTGDEARRGNRRGAYGGVVQDRRPQATETSEGGVEDVNSHSASGPASRGRGKGRGRGDRGGRGVRGGRGDTNGSAPRKDQNQVPPPSANDFPDLPPSTKPAQTDSGAPNPMTFPKKAQLEKTVDTEAKKVSETAVPWSPDTPVDGSKRSWADQVEREGNR